MTTAISFFRQNDTGSRVRALSLLEKLVFVLESNAVLVEASDVSVLHGFEEMLCKANS